MRSILCAAAALCLSATAGISATIDDATPDYFNGSGVANGDFAGVRVDGIEIGLRGRLRYDLTGQPQNTWNYDGDRTYTVDPAQSNPPADRSGFNWDWAVNVDYDGSTGFVLSDLTYLMQVDTDPTAGTSFLSFDPIISSLEDHEIGDNSMTDGLIAGDSAAYQTLLDTYSIAQNSWNLGFFSLGGLDPNTEGLYTISLSVFDTAGAELASTSIDVRYGNVPAVPLPATLPLLAAALGGVGFIARRRKG